MQQAPLWEWRLISLPARDVCVHREELNWTTKAPADSGVLRQVSLCSYDWPPYVDQAGLECKEIRLPLPPKCWDQRREPPLLVFLLVLNVTKKAEPVACKEIWVSPAQTKGKSFRAKTRRKADLESEMSNLVVAVLMKWREELGEIKTQF